MKYNEPWSSKVAVSEDAYEVIYDKDGNIIRRESRVPVERRYRGKDDINPDTRIVACVNSLSGVPDACLEDRAAAKAILISRVVDSFCGNDLDGFFIRVGCYGESCDPRQIFNTTLRLRSRGADFGELNTLIDSFA